MKRRLIHYRISSAFMIIGIIVSFICFFNSMNLYHLMSMQKKESKQYEYVSHKQCSYLNMGEAVELNELLNISKGIVRIQELILYRDAAQAPGLTEVIMTQREKLNYPVVEGEIPETDDDIEEPTVILGRKFLEETTEQSGKRYYTLDGIPFRVCAVIGTASSDLFDYKVIIYSKGLPESIQSKWNTLENMIFALESNQANTDEMLKEIQTNVKQSGKKIAINGGGTMEDLLPGVDSDGKYYVIVLLFCIVNVVIVSEYWIKSRYKEIALRKMLGYSDGRIYALLYRDMVINVAVAVGMAAIIQVIIQNVWKEYIQLYMNEFGYYIGISVLFVFGISAVFMCYPIKLLRKSDVLQQVMSKT